MTVVRNLKLKYYAGIKDEYILIGLFIEHNKIIHFTFVLVAYLLSSKGQ